MRAFRFHASSTGKTSLCDMSVELLDETPAAQPAGQ
jgi:hypothetical protein